MKLVSDSQDPLVMPFLLNLASLSDLIASTVINVSAELINEVMVEKIASLLPIWYAKDIIVSKVTFHDTNYFSLISHDSFAIRVHLGHQKYS